MRLLLFILVMGSTWAMAQVAEAPPRPTAPFLATMPGDAAWQINYISTAPVPSSDATPAPTDPSAPPKPPPPPTLKTTMVVRNNGVRRERSILSNGNVLEKWVVKSYVFTQHKPTDPFGVASAVWMGIGVDGVYPDFPDLVWADITNFKDVETKNGQKCFTYYWGESGRGDRPLDSPLPIEPTTLWISIATKLPLAVENDHLKATYIFGQPVAELTLPDDCKKILHDAEVTRARIMGQQMQRQQ